jgi:hypothetical protein
LTMQKLVLTSPISSGRLDGIVRSQTEAKEFKEFLFAAVIFRDNDSERCLVALT